MHIVCGNIWNGETVFFSQKRRRAAHQYQWPHLVCAVLVNSDTLPVNYSVKQSQLTKLTSKSRARNPEESNKVFDRTIRE